MQLMAVGTAITLAFVAIALLVSLFQTWGWIQDPTESLINPVHEPPTLSHWFGTTRQGYDVFSRTMFGTQAAWRVVLLATALSLAVGVPLGLVSGYLGGRLDKLLLFLMDTIYTLPGLLLSLTLAFVVGRGVFNAAIALSISYVPQYYRVVRNHTVSVKTELFIEAAQAMGASTWTVLTRYLLLNVIQSVPVLFTLNAADAILTLGGLGFLGLGLPSEVPEWGHDLRLALDALPTGIWWTAFFPGMTMTLMVVGLSLLGEGLNEFVNPKLRQNS
ncbi:MAG: ABC transporter permease, partial [Hormoscilla sp.]